MKKLIIILAVMFLASVASAQEWYTANQHQVGWEAGEGAISYNIFLKPAKGTVEPILIGNVSATQAPFTLPGVGRYFPCAQSVSEDGDVSEIVCSDLPENCLNGITFGLKMNPGKPQHLR